MDYLGNSHEADDEMESEIRRKARSNVTMKLHEHLSITGGKIQSRQVAAVINVLIDQEERLLRLEARA